MRLGQFSATVVFTSLCGSTLLLPFVSDVRAEEFGFSCPAGCRPGLVWRTADPSDLVCVLPSARESAHAENALAAERRVLARGAAASFATQLGGPALYIERACSPFDGRLLRCSSRLLCHCCSS